MVGRTAAATVLLFWSVQRAVPDFTRTCDNHIAAEHDQLCISFFVLHSSISPFRKIYHKKNILLSKRLFTPPLNERDHLASNPSGESAHPKQPVTPPERFQISLIYFTAAGNGPVTFKVG